MKIIETGTEKAILEQERKSIKGSEARIRAK